MVLCVKARITLICVACASGGSGSDEVILRVRIPGGSSLAAKCSSLNRLRLRDCGEHDVAIGRRGVGRCASSRGASVGVGAR